MREGYTRVTLDLAPEAYRRLKDQATAEETTMTHVVRNAIKLAYEIARIQHEGGTIACVNPKHPDQTINVVWLG